MKNRRKLFLFTLVIPFTLLFPLTLTAQSLPKRDLIPWILVKPIDVMPLPQNPSSQPSRLSLKNNKKTLKNNKKKIPKGQRRLTREQMSRFRYLMNLIISPCCFTQPVAVHPSSASDKIKAEVKQFLLDGYTNDQIIDYYVKQYGERILSIPRDNSLYLIPLIVSLFIILLTIWLIRRWHLRSLKLRQNSEQTTSPSQETPTSSSSSPKNSQPQDPSSTSSWFSVDS